MPIYEYQCPQCSERFAVLQSMGEDGSKLHCPKCNAGNPKRVLSSFFSPTPSSTTSATPETNPTNPRRSKCGPYYRLEQLKKQRRHHQYSS